MKTIELYILRRATTMFFAAFLTTLAMVWITQAITRVNLITDSGGSIGAFFKVATYQLPMVMPEVLPFSVAIGLGVTFATMNTDSELVVIHAAGAGRMTLVRPALILATAAAILSFTLTMVFAPSLRMDMRMVIAESRGDLLSAIIEEGTFNRIEKDLFIQVAKRGAGGQLSGIFVADMRDDKMQLDYYARDGMVVRHEDRNLLVMRDGEVHRKGVDGAVSVIRFTSYSFNLDAFAADTGKTPTIFPKDRPFSYLLSPDPNDPVMKHNPRAFRLEIDRRLSDWMLTIVSALVVLAVAMTPVSHRQARVPPLVSSLAIVMLVRWLTFLVAGQAKKSELISLLQYVIPIAMGLIAIRFIAANRSMEIPLRWVEAGGDMFRRAAENLAALRWRLRGQRVAR